MAALSPFLTARTWASVPARVMASPRNPYSYLQAKGEGNKGASYKYTWRPDWRVPPGVSQWKVLAQVVALCAIAAIPVYGLPFVR